VTPEPLTPAWWTRAGKVAARLASPFENEVVVAARMATEMLRAAGLNWSDVFARAADAPPPIEAGSWRELALFCAIHDSCLNSWERSFCAGILSRKGDLSEKQRRKLSAILRKVRAAVGSAP
jgi:hypothetical protein